MTTFIPTAVLLLSLAGGYGGGVSTGSTGMYGGGVQQTTESLSEAEYQDDARDLLLAFQATGRGMSQQNRVLRTAFVVPGPDLASEAIAQISEDLAVMCRIFDKATVWANNMPTGYSAGNVPLDISGVEVAHNLVLTQALYLDGYGAVFFLPVDFLLAAPPEEQKETKAEPSGDPLWSQTADELRGAPQGSPGPSKLQYNAQRVENLKAALLGTLRHAANLRTRRAEDAISIVIATRLGQAGRRDFIYGSSGPYGAPFSQLQAIAPAGASPDLPTVLVLRTTKSDVDALAKGSLSQEQFATKVQALKSWTNPGPVEAGLGGSIGGIGGGVGGGMWAPSQRR